MEQNLGMSVYFITHKRLVLNWKVVRRIRLRWKVEFPCHTCPTGSLCQSPGVIFKSPAVRSHTGNASAWCLGRGWGIETFKSFRAFPFKGSNIKLAFLFLSQIRKQPVWSSNKLEAADMLSQQVGEEPWMGQGREGSEGLQKEQTPHTAKRKHLACWIRNGVQLPVWVEKKKGVWIWNPMLKPYRQKIVWRRNGGLFPVTTVHSVLVRIDKKYERREKQSSWPFVKFGVSTCSTFESSLRSSGWPDFRHVRPESQQFCKEHMPVGLPDTGPSLVVLDSLDR